MLLTAALLAALAAAPDTAPSAARSDAYLDVGGRELVEAARARQDSVEGRIGRYQVVARSRATVGLRALRRDRVFYRCEAAARVDWRRGARTRVEVLGSREVAPLMSGKVDVGDHECGGFIFDPTDDRLGISGIIRLSDDDNLKHPLAPGSEAHYRFRSGGTTTLRLPGGRTIRLHELEVIPRRSDPMLLSGSLWLEEESRAVVRAVLRMARPFDLRRDASDDDLPGFMNPVRADLKFLTVEYALQDGQWWLPRLVALEGEGQVGAFARVPVRLEQSYGEYQVESLPPGMAPAPIDTALARPSCKRQVSINIPGGVDVSRTDTAAAEPRNPHERIGCTCTSGRCYQTVVVVKRDTAQLLSSEYLPPSIFSGGEAVVSDAEMRRLLEEVKGIAEPWRVARPDLRWGLQGLDLFRYNRVEGLSVAARAEADLGRAAADATLRLGLAGLVPGAEVGATRRGPVREQRLALYARVDDVWGRGLSLGNSLSALFLGRDEGDYFRTLGAELIGRPAGDGFGWRLFAERQLPLDKQTDFSFSGWIGDGSFRENIRADPASQAGVALSWRASRGLNPVGWRGGVGAAVEASTGTYSFARPSLTLSGSAPLPVGLLASLTAAAGTSVGAVPTQSLWYLGGARTVRGYGGNATRGDAFWTGRLEVGTTAPAVRLVAFSDAGWAGERGRFELDPQLLSAGAGVSLFDGLFRLDLARALRNGSFWRLELHLDAPL